MRVIYIAGAAHSGSTLLDMMLNAHPAIMSVGEVLNLNRVRHSSKTGKVKETKCSCGAVGLLQCAFWSSVNTRIKQTGGTTITRLDLNEHLTANSLLFHAISDVSGKKFVVDSSKVPNRLQHLLLQEELKVYPIHLVRKPAGQIASVIKKHGLAKSILYYEVVHARVRQMLKSVPHSLVRYEDLVNDPKRTLQSILEPLGLEFDTRQLAWAEQEKHSFAGNHARFQSKSELVLDEAWKYRLTPAQRLLIDLGTVLSRNFSP
jgi:hypothetical protein